MKTKTKVLLVCAVSAVIATGATPFLLKRREARRFDVCQNNLRLIDGAKEQDAMGGCAEGRCTNGSFQKPEHIVPYLRNERLPICPSGGKYKVNPVGESPICTKHGIYVEGFSPDFDPITTAKIIDVLVENGIEPVDIIVSRGRCDIDFMSRSDQKKGVAIIKSARLVDEIETSGFFGRKTHKTEQALGGDR